MTPRHAAPPAAPPSSAPSAARFEGWPPEAMDFLRELEAHNDRAWFARHRARYETAVAGPAHALAAHLDAGAGPGGGARVLRPFTDVRFHPGPPIREHVAVSVEGNGASGGYVQLSLDGLLVAAGLWMPARDQLARLREAVDDGRRAGSLRRALATAREAGMTPGPPELVRAPRGYPLDHPRIDLLRHTRMTVARHHPPAAWLHTGECLRRIDAALDAARPLVRWLERHVGPSTLPARRP